jgi:hypothetical protein
MIYLTKETITLILSRFLFLFWFELFEHGSNLSSPRDI